MDRPRSQVPVGSFCLGLTDSPPGVADRLRGDRGPSALGPRGLSARAAAGVLSPLLLGSWFRFGIILGLFLGLVRP
jgi:hypothetical protein